MSREPNIRVLVVDDEPIIGMELEALLREAGYDVVGPVGTVAEALALARDGDVDCALLDVKLGNETVFPLADELDKRGLPFIIVTGHSRDIVPVRYRRRAFFAKPYLPAELLDAVARLTTELPPLRH
jgi:DNA-binding response OmpR family regulator